ncbi:2-hydroxyacid dehydrogenase [Mesorhizobium sp. LHD-90]|uniref:2-hydroxyacid dehydrogenase n=1 Tax=Mesorhizobium sp. LHD-90 TaxID=3071414 RepID=UPI0027E1CEBE|nr:2-hydroxyacid dehydrogenase [Mesorhizobium sp. LHD-90]MDQ6437298.1 2-hydroxyacid dehydrogenase [Mesorhizobium sp. LHD-90]
MPEQLSDVTILVTGAIHERVLARLAKEFRLVRIERADLSLVDDAVRNSVRGVSAVSGITASFIDGLPKLEIVANFGVGYDGVDARHAGGKNIMVTNTPDVLTEEVADTAIGLLLNTLREFSRAENWLRDGRWVKEGPYPLTRATLRGRKIGIVGMGRIGKAIARRLEGFGLPIAYHNRRPAQDVSYPYFDTLGGLAHAVDTLISVAPGGAATEKMVGAAVLSALGPEGVFVNIGRGSTVDEEALAAALADGTILAAGLDVFAREPHVPQALLDLPNATLLPHVGSASVHTRNAMADLAVDNLVSWFSKRVAITPVPETAHVTAG